MHDKLLIYALMGSIGLHVLVLGLVGTTSAAKPIEVEQLKIVRVDVIKTPEEAVVRQDKQDAPKPKVEETSPPEAPYVPPPSKMVVDKHPPKPVPKQVAIKDHSTQDHKPYRQADQPGNRKDQPRAAYNSPPGDPGGALAGISSPNGEDLGQVPQGHTQVGWVPGSDSGQGQGSGSGAGIGKPDPDPEARPGPGNAPSPGIAVEPPPPPPPKVVGVTVCSISGYLPGPNCDKKQTREFREGSQPERRCDICKAHEPKHRSTLADVAEPVLVKDSEPNIPDIDDSGDFIVKLRYTVNTDGSVSDIEIVDSSGIRAIDRAVVQAASKMKYRPAVQNGESRSVKIRRTYKISL